MSWVRYASTHEARGTGPWIVAETTLLETSATLIL